MQIVFLNQFERVVDQVEERAQVFIGELEGLWSTGWRTIGPSGSSVDELWYEGVSWEELLAGFRHGVARRMGAGFRPVLDGMLEDTPFWDRQPAIPMLLQCYADLRNADETVAGLRIWRRAKSAEEKRSAYLIANNRELQMLAVYAPKTLQELEQIPGFGKVKVERYGNDLIGLLKDVERTHEFPLEGWVRRAVSDEQLSGWIFRVKEEKYGKALDAVRDKRSLLAAIRDGGTLATIGTALNCPRRKLLERIEQLDEEGYDVLPFVDRELVDLAPDEELEISTAFSQLGDRYLKPLKRKVYGETDTDEGELERQYEKLRMMRIRVRRKGQTAV